MGRFTGSARLGKLEGADELLQALNSEAKIKKIKDCVQKYGALLHSSMSRKASFRGHFVWNKKTKRKDLFVRPTGHTKRSITIVKENNGLSVAVGPQTDYSAYLEEGTRYMSAQSFVKPALREVGPQFIESLEEIVNE